MSSLVVVLSCDYLVLRLSYLYLVIVLTCSLVLCLSHDRLVCGCLATVLSYLVVSCRVLSRLVSSRLVSSRLLSCLVMPASSLVLSLVLFLVVLSLVACRLSLVLSNSKSHFPV